MTSSMTRKIEISPEKSKEVLSKVLAKEENKTCADCLSKGPRWASWNIGVMLCIRCSGIHRSLGVHISRVKSVNLDTWNYEQLVSICRKGNAWARKKYEANLPQDFTRPQSDSAMEHFIRNKYERLKFCSDGEISLCSIEEFELDSKRSSKPRCSEKKGSNISLSKNPKEANVVARPTTHHAAPPTQQTQVRATTNGDFTQHQKKSHVDDLLNLDTPSFSAPPAAPTQVLEQRPSSDLTGLFSALQPGIGNDPSAQQQPAATTQTQPAPMSKDTIMSLYGSGMTQQNPYAMQGSYNAQVQQPNMMGYQQQMAPNMGYVNYNQQGTVGYPQQQANMQAMQQQYQWQQQQMQMQMQNMQLGAANQMAAQQVGMRSYGSYPGMGPQPNMYGGPQPQTGMSYASNYASQPSIMMNPNMNRSATGGQQMTNGQTLNSNLWK